MLFGVTAFQGYSPASPAKRTQFIRRLHCRFSRPRSPVAVIRTPYLHRIGTRAGPLARFLLRGRKTKHWMRLFYSLQSLWKLKRSSLRRFSSKDFLQAGKSVAGVGAVEPTAEIIRRFAAAAAASEAEQPALAASR